MKKSLILILMTVLAAPVLAQDITVDTDTIKAQEITALKHYKAADNLFVSAGFGGNFSMSENTRFLKYTKNMNPSYSLDFGKWLAPSIGIRLEVNHLIQTGAANMEAVEAFPEIYGNGKYKFKMYTVSFDALTNINNVLWPYKETNRSNVYLVTGLGFLRTFGFEKKVKEWAELNEGAYEIYTRPRNYLMGRVGLGYYYQISNPWDLGIEFTANITNDKYNGVVDDQMYDTFLMAKLYVTYHFRDHFGDRRFKYRTLSDYELLYSLNQQVNNARKELEDIKQAQEEAERAEQEAAQKEAEEEAAKQEAPKNELEVLDLAVHFKIDKYQIVSKEQKDIVAAAAQFLKDHPDATMTVTGFADVQTAYPAYNLKLSARRAQNVYSWLVIEHGISPNRLRIDFRGDTVQPYIQNDLNRVVIFVIQRNK